jgi:hypothetical protein
MTIMRMNFSALGVIVKLIFSSRSLIAGYGIVDDAGILDRTHGDALSLVEMTQTFRAFFRIDNESSALFRNGHIGAFRFTGRAIRALRTDDFIRHCRDSYRWSVFANAALRSIEVYAGWREE